MAKFKQYITLDELKAHSNNGDLWIAIEGKVYDVSEWVKSHPGGDFPLLNLSGQDSTDAFIAFHPSTAWIVLDKFANGFYLKGYSASDISKDYRNLVYDFTKMGLFEKKGHGVFITMCLIGMLFALSVYGVLCCEGVWLHLLCAVMIGFLWIQSGWIGHDSGHYQVTKTPKLSRFVQTLSGNCLSGISMAWWKWTHNGHHIACNSLDYDPGLQHMPILAVSSKLFRSITSCFYQRIMKFDYLTRFLVSYQHWTFYPVMCIARLSLFAQSFELLFSKRKVPHRYQELVALLVFWVWYPVLVSCLPNWGERMMFVTASFGVTGIQHVQLCINHFASSVYVGPPTGNDWFEKQTSGTLNIKCSPWMDWFHGGLQFQIEHHLFPRLPRCQLRKVSLLVEELCVKHGLSYNSATFWEANVLTIRTLRNAALQARDFTKPVQKNLVWEAVNAGG